MRKFALLCQSLALIGTSAFLLPNRAPQKISPLVPLQPNAVDAASPATTMMASTVTPIKEPDLTEADMITPPQTFFECILKAYEATAAALKDGHTLLEVEFPPLSAAEMANQALSANVLTAANLELAINFAEYFTREGKEVAVMLPDQDELDLVKDYLGTVKPKPNITLRAVKARATESAESFGELFMGIFSRAAKGRVLPVANCDMYVCIVSSGQELPDLEQIHLADPSKPMVFFNLNLETHRGDLGLPAFASKDLHYRFLSKIKPVLFLRTRQYSLTLSKYPFVLNYQGALFRVYPGGYQCLLDTNTGAYRRVETFTQRPALGEFKQVITDALNVDDSKLLEKLRQGVVVQKTWWEKEEDWSKEESNAWRT